MKTHVRTAFCEGTQVAEVVIEGVPTPGCEPGWYIDDAWIEDARGRRTIDFTAREIDALEVDPNHVPHVIEAIHDYLSNLDPTPLE